MLTTHLCSARLKNEWCFQNVDRDKFTFTLDVSNAPSFRTSVSDHCLMHSTKHKTNKTCGVIESFC